MASDLDACVTPGECPLCLEGIERPTEAGQVIPILALHFGSTCSATELHPTRSTA